MAFADPKIIRKMVYRTVVRVPAAAGKGSFGDCVENRRGATLEATTSRNVPE